MSIEYVVGDATQPTGEGNRIIAHVCNDIGRWGKGFVLAISRRWSEPEQAFKRWYNDRESMASLNEPFRLGAVQLVPVEPSIWVCNMIGQHGIAAKQRNSPEKKPPIRYEPLAEALSSLATISQELQATVHMPRIGCGLAGGNWDEVEIIIRKTLIDLNIDVFVYDMPPEV